MSDKAKSILIPVVGIGLFIGIMYLLFAEDPGKKKPSPAPTKEPEATDKKILFVGDSLTAAFGIDGKGYVDQLRLKRPDLDISRIAVTGKQTGWMLDQLKKELSAGRKYDVIGIWGGINDIYAKNSISEAKKNLQEMYDLAHKAGARVIAMNTIPSVAYKMSTPQKVKLTNDLNAWINTNPTKDALLDVNALVKDEKGATRSEYMQPDKLHLTESAQKQVASKLLELL